MPRLTPEIFIKKYAEFVQLLCGVLAVVGLVLVFTHRITDDQYLVYFIWPLLAAVVIMIVRRSYKTDDRPQDR